MDERPWWTHSNVQHRLDHNWPVSIRLFANMGAVASCGAKHDSELAMVSQNPGSRWMSRLDELRYRLEKLDTGFPEVSRKHIMENVPLSILAIPGTTMCTPKQIKTLNEYLATACFRSVQINQNRHEINVGNGGKQYIPYALNPMLEYSPAGKMLWFMKGQSSDTLVTFKRLCVVQQLEWILWRSKK